MKDEPRASEQLIRGSSGDWRARSNWKAEEAKRTKKKPLFATDEEPIFNEIGYWAALVHARMTTR